MTRYLASIKNWQTLRLVLVILISVISISSEADEIGTQSHSEFREHPPLLWWTPAQESEWHSAQEQIRDIAHAEMPQEQMCQDLWRVRWDLAKTGNLQARYSLYETFERGDTIRILGRPVDHSAQRRILDTLLLHSLGSPGMSELVIHIRVENRMVDPKDARAFLGKYSPILRDNPMIAQCLLEKGTQQCTKMAEETNIIPTFDRFAFEIEALIKAGAKIYCPGREAY